MRNRALTILLCAALVLSLAACGGSETGRDRDSANEKDKDGQETADLFPWTDKDDNEEPDSDKDREPEDTENPPETEPEETAPAETQPTEPDPTEPEPTEPEPTEPEPTEPEPTEPEPTGSESAETKAAAFLALLRAEYQDEKALGVTEKHTYIPYGITNAGHYCYIHPVGETVYLFNYDKGTVSAFDIETKTLTELSAMDALVDSGWGVYCYLDGIFYSVSGMNNTIRRTDLNGNMASLMPYNGGPCSNILYYGGGFFCTPKNDFTGDSVLVSTDLQVIATVPVPQREAAHGLTEPVTMYFDDPNYCPYTIDGMVFVVGGDYKNEHLYRLDAQAETPEWTDMGELSSLPDIVKDYMSGKSGLWNFYGKYYINDNDGCLYDISTWEKVFEFGELPLPISPYLGGDRYIIRNGGEFRWVSLTDGAVSDPLKLPEKWNGLCLLDNDAPYFVYYDQSGIFLWDFNTGEEKTIYMFE